MYSKQLRRHGHSHGHRHHGMMRHGERHENHGHFFRHSGHRMCHDFLKEKHHRGMRGTGIERRCFSESELPSTASENARKKDQEALIRHIVGEFFRRRHHWRHGSRSCEKCGVPLSKETVQAGCTNNVPNSQSEDKNEGDVISAEDEMTDETNNISKESTGNIEEPNKVNEKTNKCRHLRHHYKRMCIHPRFCLSCLKKGADVTKNKVTSSEGGEKDAMQGSTNKHFRGHHKGKRGHGFRKVCPQCVQESDTTENEGITDREEGRSIKKGYRRRHYRGHHEGRRECGYRRIDLRRSEELGSTATSGQEGETGCRFRGRYHPKGKWGHGSHREHHRGWKRHGYCVTMIDAAVNTENFENSAQEKNTNQEISSQEDTNENQVLDQHAIEEVGQERANDNSAEVLEVVNSLRKSSLE